MNVFQYNKFGIFVTLIALYFLLHLAFTYLFNSLDIYIQTFQDQLSITRIEELFKLSSKQQWFNYVLLPIIVFSRIFYTSTSLYIGAFFTELKINFGKLFKVALITDFVYVIDGFTKLVFLIFFKQVNTLEDLQFQPLSVMELLNDKNVDPLFVYPLNLLNVFEVGYFLILAWLLVDVINKTNEKHTLKYWQSLKLVTVSYGSGLLLWVLVVMFITLNIT